MDMTTRGIHMLNHWRQRWACAGLVLALALAVEAAQGQNTDVLQPPEPCDGTLWFRSIGAGGVSDGSAQLGVFDGGSGWGLQWAALTWNDQSVWLTQGAGAALLPTQEVFKPLMPPAPFLACKGVATLAGGFIVTTDPAGAVVAVNPHLGAFIWDGQGLWAVQVLGGVVTVQFVQAGAFDGVAVLASDTQDINPAPAAVNSHIVSSALVYGAGGVFRVSVDMSAAGILVAPVVPVVDPAGAAIANLRGVTVVDSALDPAFVPSDPQGAAYLWTANRVLFYRHPAGADVTIEIVDAGGAAIVGCWGVMPIYSEIFAAAALPANPPHKVMIWDAYDAYVATGNPAVAVPDDGGAPMQTQVEFAGNPLVKRQASFLYEVQAKSHLTNTRGMVIGLNQRRR